ncbi:RP4-816N1.8 [Branchiostoma lanceolatum]|uniref:RP4-816N1.8 protein n=1 Tax=Branchiostoma lanceolatum TaxID=7740 RepID=A0A8J9ZKQ6_BRALA|nr:RP4-816N1.8 [Branchiostoma lanceolatum]
MIALHTMPARGPTIAERENLANIPNPSRSGFTPRPIQRLATVRPPRTATNIEINHKLRTSVEDSTPRFEPPPTFHLWQEVGWHEPMMPPKQARDYNSNVWRNFTALHGYHLRATPKQGLNDTVAAMYPINMPRASHMGRNTFAKYVAESRTMVRDPGQRRDVVLKLQQQLDEFQQLRVESEMRRPPVDELGRILPPEAFKSYPRPQGDLGSTSGGPTTQSIYDSTLRTYTRQHPGVRVGDSRSETSAHSVGLRRAPLVTKLAYSQNNPQYTKVMEEQKLILEWKKAKREAEKDARTAKLL